MKLINRVQYGDVMKNRGDVSVYQNHGDNPEIKRKVYIDYNDWCPPAHFFEMLLSKGAEEIYCTNLNYRHDKCKYFPLGVGLWGFDYTGISATNNIDEIGEYLLNKRSKIPYKNRRRIISLDFYNGNRKYVESNSVKMNVFNNRLPVFNEFIRRKDEFLEKGWTYYYSEERVTVKEVWDAMSECVFVISPPGNGNDCHRTWEALVLGLVPIIKRTDILDEELLTKLGAIYVNDYSEVTPELLDEYMDKHEYSELLPKELRFDAWL